MASISSSSSSSSSTSTPLIGISYPRPTGKVFVDANSGEKSTYTKGSSLEHLVQLMRTSGKPLVAFAALASSYREKPKPYGIFNKQIVYRWEPSAKRADKAQKTFSLILGAKHQPSKGDFVFFVEYQFIRLHECTALTIELAPNRPREGYYVVEHATFNEYLQRLMVPFQQFQPSIEDKSVPRLPPPPSSAMPALTNSQKAYVKKLRAFGPASALLKDKAAKAKCKTLGQEIFDRYKKKEKSSLRGYNVMVRICNALAFNSKKVKTRKWVNFKDAVTEVWVGIGDSIKRWGA